MSETGREGIDIKKMQEAGADDRVVEVYRLLKLYREDSERKEWERDVYKRGWEVAWGKKDALWTEEEKAAMLKKKQIPVAINDCSKGIQGAAAVATASRPGINVRPVGSSDMYVAELLKRAFDYVWGQNAGGMVNFDVVKECKTGSLGVFEVRFDESKGRFGKIVFISDNPLDYYFDKKSRRADKSDSHIIKAHLITRRHAKDNYDVTDEDLAFAPVAVDVDGEPGISSAGYPGEDEYARMESSGEKDSGSGIDGGTDKDGQADVWEIEAWLVKKQKSFSVIVVTQAGAVHKFDFETAREAKDAVRELETYGQKASYKEKVTEVRVQRIIVGKKLISEETNPCGLDADGDPVVPKLLMGHDRSYNGYFVSPTYRAIEISRSRNKRRSQAIYTVSKNLDAPIVRTEGTKWENDEQHGDSLIVPKDAPFAPSRLLPGTTSGELMAMEQRDELALNDEYDMQEVMKGKAPPGVDAARALNALQEQAGMMSMPFISLEEWTLVKLAKVIYSLMLRHWPRSLWERLIDEEEKAGWQPEKDKQINPETGEPIPPDPNDIGMKWLKALEMIRPADPSADAGIELDGLDITFVAGSTMPTNRMAKRVDAMDMVKAGVYPPEVALEYIDDPLKDKAAAIIRNNRQMEMQTAMAKGK